MNSIERVFLSLANAFPIWVLTGAALALWQPATAMWFQPDWIPLFLGIIMLSMGLTLDFQDFKRVIKIPGICARNRSGSYIGAHSLHPGKYRRRVVQNQRG